MRLKTTPNLVSNQKVTRLRRITVTALLAVIMMTSYQLQNNVEQISGIVNSYAKVTAVGNNYLDLADASEFQVGDKVLIIQMKGATIVTANDSTFGNVTSWGNAGNYEFGKIVSKSGNRINFVHKICKAYDPAHAVQAVKVPVYKKVDIVGTLTASPWDGEKGGIVAIWASGRVKLKKDIDVSAIGFRGGQFNGRAKGGEMTYTCTIESGKGGRKGEGIVEIPNTGCMVVVVVETSVQVVSVATDGCPTILVEDLTSIKEDAVDSRSQSCTTKELRSYSSAVEVAVATRTMGLLLEEEMVEESPSSKERN